MLFCQSPDVRLIVSASHRRDDYYLVARDANWLKETYNQILHVRQGSRVGYGGYDRMLPGRF